MYRVFLPIALSLCLLLSACHPGGKRRSSGSGAAVATDKGYIGSQADGSPTDEERERMDYDEDNINVPPELTPDVYQGKVLDCTEIYVDSSLYSATGAGEVRFFVKLGRGNVVQEGSLRKADADGTREEYTFGAQGVCDAGISAEDTQSISLLSLHSTASDGTSLQLVAHGINLESKTVIGNFTTYTGSIGSGRIGIGNRIIDLGSGNTTVRIIYRTMIGR